MPVNMAIGALRRLSVLNASTAMTTIHFSKAANRNRPNQVRASCTPPLKQTNDWINWPAAIASTPEANDPA